MKISNSVKIHGLPDLKQGHEPKSKDDQHVIQKKIFYFRILIVFHFGVSPDDRTCVRCGSL